MECFSKNDEGKLDELIFIHRFAFTIAYVDNRIHSATFSSTYGSRSIDWSALDQLKKKCLTTEKSDLTGI